MQLALAAAAKFAGTGIASAAGGASAAAGAGSTALSILQGASTIFSVLGQIGAGNAAANASEQAAIQAEIQADQEKVKATQKETRIKQELLSVLGDNEVAAAAAGIDITAGITQQANQSAKKRANSEIAISRQDQDLQSALYRLRGQGLRQKAKSQRSAGLLSAFGSAADFGIDLAARG